MRYRLHARRAALLIGVALAVQWSLAAQTRPATRPISYDVMDSWRSIQGTRVSSDGRWLAYALTAQGEDGELVVRNLGSGQELRSPRGTGPSFTQDGKFIVFTIAQTKADEEREARQNQGRSNQNAGPEGAGQGTGRGGQAARTPRTGLGIMALPSGEVTTIEKTGSFRLPEESSAWLAYYKGVGGTSGGGRGGAGGRGGRGGGGRQAGPATPPAPAAAERGQENQEPGSTPREKRKDPGSDLILRNLATTEEITIPDVTEYRLRQEGRVARVLDLVPGGRERRGLRAPDERRLRQDASLRTRPLQEPHVRRRRAAARVPERQRGVRQAGVPVPPVLLESGGLAGGRDRLCRHGRHAGRHGRRRHRRAAIFERRQAPLPGDRSAAGGAARSGHPHAGGDPGRSLVVEGSDHSADAARARRPGAPAELSCGRSPARQEARAARDRGNPDRESDR